MTFLSSLVSTTLILTPVICLLLLLTPLLERFAPRSRCWLWMAVIVGLCVPFLSSLSFLPRPVLQFDVAMPTVFDSAPQGLDGYGPAVPPETLPAPNYVLSPDNITVPGDITMYSYEDAEAGIPDAPAPLPKPPLTLPSINLLTGLLLVWLVGICLSLIYHAASHLAFRRFIRRWSEPVAEEWVLAAFDSERARLGIGPGVRLERCKGVKVPMLLGFFKPVVLLPDPCCGAEDLGFVIRHELTHYKRRDLWYKLALLLIRSVYWFNPAVHWMAAQANKDLETACDAQTVRGMDLAQRIQYSEIILKMAAGLYINRSQLTTCFIGDRNVLQQRLLNILGAAKRRGVMVFAALGLAVLSIGLLVGFRFVANAEAPPAGPGTEIPGPEHPAPEGEPAPLATTQIHCDVYTDGFNLNGYIYVLTHTTAKSAAPYPLFETLEYGGNPYTLAYSGSASSYYGDQALRDIVSGKMKELLDDPRRDANNTFILEEAEGPFSQTPESLFETYYDAGKTAFASAVIPYISADMVNQYAETAYTEFQVDMFSILLGRLSRQMKDEYFVKAAESGNIAFTSILVNHYSGGVDQYAEIAYNSSQTVMFSILANRLSPQMRDAYAEIAYTRSQAGMFSVLIGHLSQQQKDRFFIKAAESGNIAFVSILLDSYKGSILPYIEKAYQSSETGMFSVLARRLNPQQREGYAARAAEDNKTAFIYLLQ